MNENLEQAEEVARKRRRHERHVKLLKLLDEILSGQFNSKNPDLDEMYKLNTSERDLYQHGPRSQYVSPADRSSYNYGYMTIDQMQAGNPNIW